MRPYQFAIRHLLWATTIAAIATWLLVELQFAGAFTFIALCFLVGVQRTQNDTFPQLFFIVLFVFSAIAAIVTYGSQ